MRRRGIPADGRSSRLIVHADDLGLAHSINHATLDAMASGGVTSASIMVPAPAFDEAAAAVARRPSLDIGLHLTLTCEVLRDRWGPVASAGRVPSLVAPDGSMWPTADDLLRHASPSHVDVELRAQVDMATRAGLTLSHLDSHMFALCRGPLRPIFESLARELRLPAFNPFAPAASSDEKRASLVNILDHGDRKTGVRAGSLDSLHPGLNVCIVHCGADDDELRAILPAGPYDAAWRQRDYEIVGSAAFRDAMTAHGVDLVTWRA